MAAHNPVGWFEIYVQDMPRATAFYQTVLGVTLEKLSDFGELGTTTTVPDLVLRRRCTTERLA